jgi:ribose 5-phosphate isomerase
MNKSHVTMTSNRLSQCIASFDSMPELDLAVDGADEFDPNLRLTKGGGLPESRHFMW